MSGVNMALDQSEAMDREEQGRDTVRMAMARMDMLVLGIEVCLNGQLLKSIGDGMLRYALMLCFFG